MPVRTRIDSYERDIDLIVRNDLSPQAQAKAVADFAAAEIKEADDTNRRVLGRLPPKTTTVDGRVGAPLDTVNPNGGSIITEWELIGEVLIWIAQTLEDRSPVISGDYKKGHTLYADGTPIDVSDTVPTAEVYTFINTVPYARRIEVGKTESGLDFLIQVPNKIYERTAKDAKIRFRGVAEITSDFAYAVDAYRLKHDQASRSFVGGKMRILRGQRKDRVAGSAVSAPAILVKFKNV